MTAISISRSGVSWPRLYRYDHCAAPTHVDGPESGGRFVLGVGAGGWSGRTPCLAMRWATGQITILAEKL